MNQVLFENEDIKQYMLYLVENKNTLIDQDVRPQLENVLLWIANNPSKSIYEYHQHINDYNLKQDDKKISIENLKKIILKLENLGLIKKVIDRNNTDKVSIKNSVVEEIYYSVTSLGLFYLLNKNIIKSIKNIVLKNRNDIFFRTFLYPYIEFETIEKLKGKDILSALSKYLLTCTKINNNVMIDHLLKIKDNKGNKIMVGFPSSSLIPESKDPYEFGPYRSIQYLKKRYDISWLDENNIKIRDEITEGIKIIRISHDKGKEEIILKVFPEKNKAILLEKINNHKIAEFDIEKHLFEKNSYIMWDLIPCNVSEYLDNLFGNKSFYFYHDMDDAAVRLCFDILQSIRYDNYGSDNRFAEIQNDRDLIVQDKKFRKLANYAKGKFESYFYHELELNPLTVTS